MAPPQSVLTEEEKEHFLNHGWVHLKGCFTKEAADEKTKDVWKRLGMSPTDKSTWTAERTNLHPTVSFDAAEFAPRAWAAIVELCGGEDRVAPAARDWRDTWIVNLGTAEGEGKKVDPRDLPQWHVDGDFFIHYLDSREQGLLVVPLYTDVEPDGGGTFICPEAMPRIARHLYDHPEGVCPHMCTRDDPAFRTEPGCDHWFNAQARKSSEFVEVTGKAGDVYLLHPLMLHAASTNPRRLVRIITNPPVFLREPFRFDRPDGDYSLVERRTLRALGKDRLEGWHITMPREEVIPDRVRRWEEAQKKEEERLGKSAAPLPGGVGNPLMFRSPVTQEVAGN